MTEKHCGNCVYLGMKSSDYIITPNREIEFLRVCENPKSMFKVCYKLATACKEYKDMRGDTE